MFHYHASSYVLSSSGAKALVKKISDYGFRHPTDQMLMKLMRTETVCSRPLVIDAYYGQTYATSPLLFKEVENIPDLVHGVDSDIKSDVEVIPEPSKPVRYHILRSPSTHIFNRHRHQPRSTPQNRASMNSKSEEYPPSFST